MGLQEDAVDVVDVDGFVRGADGFDHAADAKVAGLAKDAVGGADEVAAIGLDNEGESVVACQLDARGFASNCPTVGCTSTPPRPAGR